MCPVGLKIKQETSYCGIFVMGQRELTSSPVATIPSSTVNNSEENAGILTVWENTRIGIFWVSGALVHKRGIV